MKFTLVQIETFICIVDGGTFHAAARQLHVTAPTISQRIHELEDAVDALLFIREGPRIKLTAEGHALVVHARGFIRAAGAIAMQFGKGNPLSGVLRLGVPHAFALFCMPDLLSHLTARYPALKTTVLISDSGTMSTKLLGHELDMAILIEPENNPKIRQKELGTSQLTWFCGKQAKMPRRMDAATLATHHLIISPPPSRLYSTVSQWFDAAGVTPMQVSGCNDPSVIIRVAESGIGLGVLPTMVIQGALDSGTIQRISVRPDLPANRVAICHPAETARQGLEEISLLIQELSAERQLFRLAK